MLIAARHKEESLTPSVKKICSGEGKRYIPVHTKCELSNIGHFLGVAPVPAGSLTDTRAMPRAPTWDPAMYRGISLHPMRVPPGAPVVCRGVPRASANPQLGCHGNPRYPVVLFVRIPASTRAGTQYICNFFHYVHFLNYSSTN